jgi:hypothetical protein
MKDSDKQLIKIPVLTTKEFVLYLEDVNDNTFIHCDIRTKWDKELKHNLGFSFKILLSLINRKINALHDTKDKKHKKFLELFDFNREYSIIGNDGKEYDIYSRR